ncbi:hypothetical protein [Taibaiella koreensis]|uniref:hypothetical protein n=1 Tax=Taibaiella koreensis TaxID=1268548 RepID=UPI000E599AD5|nr:hypothetical protein [Taibaiella koreensis]
MNVKQEYTCYSILFLVFVFVIPYSFIQTISRLSNSWSQASLFLAITGWIVALLIAFRRKTLLQNNRSAPVARGLRLLLAALNVLTFAVSTLIIIICIFASFLDGRPPGLH